MDFFISWISLRCQIANSCCDVFRSQDAREPLQISWQTDDDECGEELHCVNYANYVCARACLLKRCNITIFYIDYGINDVFNGTPIHTCSRSNETPNQCENYFICSSVRSRRQIQITIGYHFFGHLLGSDCLRSECTKRPDACHKSVKFFRRQPNFASSSIQHIFSLAFQ